MHYFSLIFQSGNHVSNIHKDFVYYNKLNKKDHFFTLILCYKVPISKVIIEKKSKKNYSSISLLMILSILTPSASAL